MKIVTAIYRIYQDVNKIGGYIVRDANGNTTYFNTDDLKRNIVNGNMLITNLVCSRNNSLMSITWNKSIPKETGHYYMNGKSRAELIVPFYRSCYLNICKYLYRHNCNISEMGITFIPTMNENEVVKKLANTGVHIDIMKEMYNRLSIGISWGAKQVIVFIKGDKVWLQGTELDDGKKIGVFQDSDFKYIDIHLLDTGMITNMHCMFANCNNLRYVNMNNINTSNVVTMSYMFDNCRMLKSVKFGNIDTSNVVSTKGMFNNCEELLDIDISNWNTNSLLDTTLMFHKCCRIEHIDLSNWNTPKLKNVSGMFDGCYRLRQLNIQNFNVKHCRNFTNMFNFCESLTTLDLSNFKPDYIERTECMFMGCKSLEVLILKNFCKIELENTFGMFSNCNELTYLDIGNLEQAGKYNYAELRMPFAWDLKKCKKLKNIIIGVDNKA